MCVYLREVHKTIETTMKQYSHVNTHIPTPKLRKWFIWDLIMIVHPKNYAADFIFVGID
jgi:hypothetical protein